MCTSPRNFFSSALGFRSTRFAAAAAIAAALGRPGVPKELLELDCPDDDDEPLEMDAAADEATDASLSLLDSPGETLRFLRFLRGRPLSFGAEKRNQLDTRKQKEIKRLYEFN